MPKKKKDVSQETPLEQEELEAEQPETEQTEEPAQPDELAKAKELADTYLNLAQRTQADFDNYRRRNETAKAAAYQDGQADAIVKILPVLDNLERAYAAAIEAEGTSSLEEGVGMVIKQFTDLLTKMDCVAIESEKGTAFDPDFHNAILTAPLEEGFAAGSIAMTLQKGYKLKEKVIRYAMVSVFES